MRIINNKLIYFNPLNRIKMRKENFTFLYKTKSLIANCIAVWSLLIFTFQELSAQCPLNCDNLVQVSVDDNCEAVITPDVMLEDPGVG